MRTKQILKAFLICTLVYVAGFLLVSCNDFNPEPQFKKGKDISVTTQNSKATNIEYITGYLSNDSHTDTGLYKVTLEDGGEILIYKGGDYATMIQLK